MMKFSITHIRRGRSGAAISSASAYEIEDRIGIHGAERIGNGWIDVKASTTSGRKSAECDSPEE